MHRRAFQIIGKTLRLIVRAIQGQQESFRQFILVETKRRAVPLRSTQGTTECVDAPSQYEFHPSILLDSCGTGWKGGLEKRSLAIYEFLCEFPSCSVNRETHPVINTELSIGAETTLEHFYCCHSLALNR